MPGLLDSLRSRQASRESVAERLAEARRRHRELTDRRASSRQAREQAVDATIAFLDGWLEQQFERFADVQSSLEARLHDAIGTPLVLQWAAAAGSAALAERWKAHLAGRTDLEDVDLAKLDAEATKIGEEIARLEGEAGALDAERQAVAAELAAPAEPAPVLRLSYAAAEAEDARRREIDEARRGASA